MVRLIASAQLNTLAGTAEMLPPTLALAEVAVAQRDQTALVLMAALGTLSAQAPAVLEITAAEALAESQRGRLAGTAPNINCRLRMAAAAAVAVVASAALPDLLVELMVLAAAAQGGVREL